MSEIDWSKAPEWASGCWEITEGGRFIRHYFVRDRKCGVVLGGDQFAEYIPRPTEWSGEGLPPVGANCMVSVLEQPCRSFEICAYHNDHVWLFGYGVGHIIEPVRDCRFLTPEQKQREELEASLQAVIYAMPMIGCPDTAQYIAKAVTNWQMSKYTLTKK